MNEFPLGPWLGLNNRLPNYALHVDKVGDFLEVADNIDIDNKGNASRRRATRNILPLSGVHSLHITDPAAGSGYVVILSTIYAYPLPEPLVPFQILSNNAPVSWWQDGGDLYYSNGTDTGRITDGVCYPLGMVTPARPPVPTTIAGALLPGLYQVSYSYANSVTGEESGLSVARQYALAATGGLHLTLPGASAGATHVNIYATTANGEVLQLAASVAVATATYDLIATADGQKGVIDFSGPLPPGKLFMSNNRLCSIANDSETGTIYIGEPWRHGYYRPVSGRLRFKAPVTVAIENQNGTYICAERTYWYAGDLGQMVQDRVSDPLPYGAVPGTEFRVPDRPEVGWFGLQGVVIADAMGQAKAVTADNIDLTPPASGISVVLSSKGISRVVSCGWCVNLDTKAATRYLDWDFNSASGGYATRTDGVHLLDTDGKVDAALGVGRLNFGTPAEKYLPAVYAGMASANPLALTVAFTDKRKIDREYTYLSRGYGEDLDIQRFDPGKGLCANWFSLTVRNVDGADFLLASLSFSPAVANRSV